MTHFPRLFAVPHKISENRTPPSGASQRFLAYYRTSALPAVMDLVLVADFTCSSDHKQRKIQSWIMRVDMNS